MEIAIEIVSFPIQNGDKINSYVSHYQRVAPQMYPDPTMAFNLFHPDSNGHRKDPEELTCTSATLTSMLCLPHPVDTPGGPN